MYTYICLKSFLLKLFDLNDFLKAWRCESIQYFKEEKQKLEKKSKKFPQVQQQNTNYFTINKD